jgi:hypothetical protein
MGNTSLKLGCPGELFTDMEGIEIPADTGERKNIRFRYGFAEYGLNTNNDFIKALFLHREPPFYNYYQTRRGRFPQFPGESGC